MTTLAIVLIALGSILALLFVGGLTGARRRQRLGAPAYDRHLAEADHALEQARASDRGWDRAVMERVVREALDVEVPGLSYERLELVLVDDRPGVHEDRAHFEAVADGQRTRVVLARSDGGWVAEGVA
jgi:hypothetical protein